jgi:phage baseplate assembly protein W
MAALDFVGRGWSYPLGVSATGGIAMATGDEEIAQSIRLILGTAFGERPMRPEFGCAIHDLVFDGVDANFAGLVSFEVRASLVRWEPRIEVQAVTVVDDPAADSVVLIGVDYTHRSTNDRRNLVFPFYSIPGE